MDLPGLGIALRQIDADAGIAETVGEPLESLTGLRIGLVPDRRAHEGDARLDRKFLRRHRPEIRDRKRPGVGIARIVTGNHTGDQRNIIQGAGKRPDRVECRAERQHAIA